MSDHDYQELAMEMVRYVRDGGRTRNTLVVPNPARVFDQGALDGVGECIRLEPPMNLHDQKNWWHYEWEAYYDWPNA